MTDSDDFPNEVIVDRIAQLAADYKTALSHAQAQSRMDTDDFAAACVAAGRARDALAVGIRAHAFATAEPARIEVPLVEIADLIVAANRTDTSSTP